MRFLLKKGIFLFKAPFVRRAILGMSEAIIDLVGALESDTLDALVE